MCTFRFNFLKNLTTPQFWLASTGMGLIVIHLNVAWRSEEFDFLGLSVLFWLAVSSLLWEKRYSLNFKSDLFSSLFGFTILTLLLIKSLFLTGGSYFPRIFPITSALGLALVASSFRGLKQYWRELLILFFLGGFEVVFSMLTAFNPSFLTAKFATYFLWYCGFNVTQQGTKIYLPTGVVYVDHGCSGLSAMIYLFSLAMLCLLFFSFTQKTKIILPIIAVVLGFLVNVIRVVLMTILVAAKQQEAFHYWHEGEGSLMFSLFSVLLFGVACMFCLRLEESKNYQSKGD